MNEIQEVEEEIRVLKVCIAEGGHVEDIESYQHELEIAKRRLAELTAAL